VGKPEAKRPLGRPKRRWEDWIRMNLRQIFLRGCGLVSTCSGQDWWRVVVGAVINVRVLAALS
jgi:hypothetical protein